MSLFIYYKHTDLLKESIPYRLCDITNSLQDKNKLLSEFLSGYTFFQNVWWSCLKQSFSWMLIYNFEFRRGRFIKIIKVYILIYFSEGFFDFLDNY